MSLMKDFDYLKIQMKDIVSVTNNFHPTNVIGSGGFGKVYKGELPSPKGKVLVACKQLDRRLGQGNVEFWKEIMILSQYKHENLISLMHFCNEDDEMILVYEYASCGSLDQYLSDVNTLTWIQRLKICVGAARGVLFLHDPNGAQQRILHRDIKSANILLDENWKAKVSDFGLSKVGPANQAHTYLVSHGVGTPGYCDPLYMEFGFLSKESDVYSFGVVLFEVLCGRLCYEHNKRALTKILVPEWRQCYDKKRLDEIVLPGLKEQMDPGSLKSFSAIAFQCVKKNREERPTMAKIVKELELSLKQQEIFENPRESNHEERKFKSRFLNRIMGRIKKAVVPSYGLISYSTMNLNFSNNHASQIPILNFYYRFQFGDILQATNGFDERLVVGKGWYGKVYRGTFPDGNTVAVKRSKIGHGQGRSKFVTKILVLSKIQHEYLVTSIGYCDDRDEMILVYEYMEKGTLQDHLYNLNNNEEKLSWSQRLEICISAAKGIHHLHTGMDAGIIHRDVKSTNILLDENYVAKVADFGIPRLDNFEESEMDIEGSFGYLDPECISSLKLTKKSDVYSFGVVLLEVLCARPALDNTLPQKEANLADWAIKQIKDGMVEKIIDPYLVNKINPNSLRNYLVTIKKCLKNTGDERPSMDDVLWDLKYALKFQQMEGDGERYDDSTMNTSLQLSMSMIDSLPSEGNIGDSQVSNTSYPGESQVFSQLKIGDAR